MYRLLISIVLISFLFTSCNLNDSNKRMIGAFQLSKEDKFIYFNYFDGVSSSIYRVDTGWTNLKLLVPSMNGISFYNPRLSNDEKEMVLLGGQPYSNISAIFMADIDGSSLNRLTNGGEIITDAFFSGYNNEIIFCKADTVARYSPVGHSEPHGDDLYSLSLGNYKIKKLSNLNAYVLADVSELNRDGFLVYSYTGEGRMYYLSKSKPESLDKIYVKNDTKESPDFLYYHPLYSKKYNTFVFSGTFDLCTMDESCNAKSIFMDKDKKELNSYCLYNTQHRILFSLKGDNCLYSINFDGTDLKKTEMKLPKRKDD